MSNKKETPVSWYNQKIKTFELWVETKQITWNEYHTRKNKISTKALQMESQKQQKYDEMLAMLEDILEAQKSGEVFHSYKIEQLIKEAKEL
jgi:hypothetical protein